MEAGPQRRPRPWPWVLLVAAIGARATSASSNTQQELENLLKTISNAPPGQSHFSVHFAFMNIDRIDEAKGTVDAHVAAQMLWNDDRWSRAIGLYCGAGGDNSSESASLCQDDAQGLWEFLGAKRSQRWLTSAERLQTELLPGFRARRPWSPVPPKLLPWEENSVTNSDPWMVVLDDDDDKNKDDGVEVGTTFAAAWFDSDVTRFEVRLDYTYWPLDGQVLELCLPELSAEMEPIVQDRLFLPPIRPFEDSEFLAAMTASAERSIETSGFQLESVEHRKISKGFFWQLCWDVSVRRKPLIISIRLALPLTMLLFVPFVSFWLPVNVAMPRVATGFLSFLALTVFRNLAYSMLPRRASTLLWIDVIMLSTNEIMFLCVLQNIVAQLFHKRISNFAAEYFDRLSRYVFPIMSIVTIALLMVLGNFHVDVTAVLVVSQLMVASIAVFLAGNMLLFWWFLPHRILRHLIHKLQSGKLLWNDESHLDPRELAQVFRLIDADQSGFVTPEEIQRTIEANGYKLHDDAERNDFLKAITVACRKTSVDEHDEQDGKEISVDFEGFSRHFTEFFGGRIARRLHRGRTQRLRGGLQGSLQDLQASLQEGLQASLQASQAVLHGNHDDMDAANQQVTSTKL